ncbi:hypothetical protein ScPMuIL_014002 [Solemya velum]
MYQPESQEYVVLTWHKTFRNGTDFDLWGQPVEAIEEYERLSKQLNQFSGADNSLFSDEQKKILTKIGVCLDLRCRGLKNPDTFSGISLDDLKRIEATLKNVLSQKLRDFPVDIAAAQIQAHRITANKHVNLTVRLDCSTKKSLFFTPVRGNLLPRPVTAIGKPVLTIRIEKIGLKDAKQYIDPYFTVSVKDVAGANLTTVQDTPGPAAVEKEDSHLVFNQDVHIQKTLDCLPHGFAVFLEFKHYKPKKKVVSTKCWTFMEKDEMRDGPAILELYKKPTDYRRKNIHLLTVKPLYLHLKLSFNV